MKFFKRSKFLFFYFIVSFIFILNLLFCFIPTKFFYHLELKTYDWSIQHSPQKAISNKIVLLTIDEKSLKELGRWDNWSRNKFPEIINKIKNYGAKVIGVDVLFIEKSGDDNKLINNFNNGITVGSFVVDFDGHQKADKIPENLKKSSYQNVLENKKQVLIGNGLIYPFEKLLKSYVALGHINMLPDDDGIVRRELVAIKYGDYIFPSFAIQIYKFYKNIDDEDVLLVPGNALFLGKQKIELDYYSTFLINYKGQEGTFPYVSASDVFFDRINPDFFKDKIVLVGATAVGLYDLRVTPVSQNMPGIEKHANVIENLIHNEFIKNTPKYILYLFLLVIYLLYIVCGKVLKVKGVSLLGLGIFIIYSFSAFLLFSYFKIYLNLIHPTITNLSIFLGVIIYKYAIEEAQSREIKRIFSSYVSDKIVNELIKNPEMAKLGGIKKEITVLFADVRGFTTFSEKHSPEEVVLYLNELLSEMTDVIMKYDGTLDKFVGDEIMALWNVPLEQSDHTLKAVKCAIEMIEKNRILAEKWTKEGKDALYIGIGINTGEAVVGNMGAENKKMDYTAIGDTVNLGARVEALTRALNADILITEYVYDKIKDFQDELEKVTIIECPPQQVKGKRNYIKVYKIEIK